MNELNHIQMVIINNLTFREKARFAELNTEGIPSDQFNYHIKKLIEDDLIEKDSGNQYSLTLQGKKFSSETDVYNLRIEKQTKTHLVPVCIKEIDGKQMFLVHKRSKHPYYGWIGFPTGKAKYSNLFETEVIRELEEETGLTGTPILKGIRHKLIHLKGSKEIIDDRTFYFYRIDNLQNELLEKTIEGENSWVTFEELENNPKIFRDSPWIVKMMDQEGVVFSEVVEEFENL